MEPTTTELAARAPLGLRLGRRAVSGPLDRTAVGEVGRALATSVGLVFLAGAGAWLAFGAAPRHGGIDPGGFVDHLGPLRDTLAAPFARWDAVWYILIAHFGYAPGPSTAFFPLYPGIVHLVTLGGVGPVAAGVAVSVLAFGVALWLLHRLTALELGADAPQAPRLAVYAMALFPMAFFFSAAYSESLYLAVSVGAFLAARRERWATAGLLGALAAATRSAGVLVLVGLVVMYVERHRRLSREALWLGLVPVGLLAYMGWLGYIGLDPLSPFHAQQDWFRHFAGPFGGVGAGASAAWAGVEQLASGQIHHVYFPQAGGDPLINSWHNLELFAFLVASVPAVIGVLRRLPRAYGAYTLAALALPLSYPVSSQPLMSLPRFLAVLFPLHMWFGHLLATHPRWRLAALGLSAGMLAFAAGQFATWHWVA